MSSRKTKKPVPKKPGKPHGADCACCSDSGSIERYLRAIEDIIERAGHAVVSVDNAPDGTARHRWSAIPQK